MNTTYKIINEDSRQMNELKEIQIEINNKYEIFKKSDR